MSSYDKSSDDIESLRQIGADEYTPFEFKDPNQVLELFSPAIASGELSLHRWQEEINTLISGNHGQLNFTKDAPLKFHLVAANGSGKDSMIIAGFAVWMALCNIRSRTIVTSKSISQLRGQTEPNIRMLAERINKLLGQKIFLILKGHIFCYNTGAEILLFCTDEEDRAEGYHPWPDYPSGKLAIIGNEAKSIPDPIFKALARCTYSHWLEISSAGKRQGQFFRSFEKAVSWEYLKDWHGEGYLSRQITSYDCPHKTHASIEADADEFGRSSHWFRSKHLSQFCAESDQYVMSEAEITLSLNDPPAKIELGIGYHAGVDAAQGGDMNSVYLFDENLFVDRIRFSLEDTTVAARQIADFLDIWYTRGLKAVHVVVDDGVASKPIFDMVRNYEYPDGLNGETVKRWANMIGVRNQSPAIGRKDTFGNRGAQNYFNFKKICHLVRYGKGWNLKSIPIKQLLSRQFQQKDGRERLYLQSKKEINKGESPDDADAIVLAFSIVDIDKFLAAKVPTAPTVARRLGVSMPARSAGVTPAQLQMMENLTYKGFNPDEERGGRNLSLSISDLE